MNIGANLKRLREQKNITQLELAEQVGVTGSMITQIERGTKTLSLPLAVEIARELGCTLNDLYRDSESEV